MVKLDCRHSLDSREPHHDPLTLAAHLPPPAPSLPNHSTTALDCLAIPSTVSQRSLLPWLKRLVTSLSPRPVSRLSRGQNGTVRLGLFVRGNGFESNGGHRAEWHRHSLRCRRLRHAPFVPVLPRSACIRNRFESTGPATLAAGTA